MDQQYFFSPGEFVKWFLPSGDAFIGRIHSVTHTSLSISRWDIVPHADGEMEAFDLPPAIADARDIHIIPIPNISSLVFVFNKSDIYHLMSDMFMVCNIFIASGSSMI
jgi:hypothetical protein